MFFSINVSSFSSFYPLQFLRESEQMEAACGILIGELMKMNSKVFFVVQRH